MTKIITWLSNLAKENPLVFSITLLLISVAILGKVIIAQDKKLDQCGTEKGVIQGLCNARIDSIEINYRVREERLNDQVIRRLNSMIQDYKDQLYKQNNLNTKVTKAIHSNTKILKSNSNQIKNLQNGNEN